MNGRRTRGRTAAWAALWIAGTLAIAAPARATTLPERFEAGVSAFREGRFEDAAAAFETLVERFGVQAPEAWLNLGAARFEAGRPGPAILALHRTVRLDPDGPVAETARVNLARVRSALNEREGEAGTGFVFGPYADAWTATLGRIDATAALAAFLACWTLFFVALGLWRLGRPAGARRAVGIAVVTLGLMLAATGTAAYGSARVRGYEVGVVLADQAALLDDAASTRPAMRLPEGLEVRVLGARGAWIHVRLGSGAEGWMSRDDLGVP